MRIVSQDKEWDIPYKNAIIRRIDKDIYAYHPVLTGGSKKIAKYSNKNNAAKAMEMLQWQYHIIGERLVFEFPKNDEIRKNYENNQ